MKEKWKKRITIGAGIFALVVILAIVCFVSTRAEKEPKYTYEATEERLPEYDTDLFRIDGKLDEKIYDKLRWWNEVYSEGEAQDPVKVRTTSYMGKKGVYFIFDVDDDKVYVDMMRASYDNSSMTVYVAAEGTHALKDNAWEIDILPNNYIAAKRYLGGYYYSAVKAKGWENQPFVRTTTKGGAMNTPECKGYIMESYFPYEFLFEGEEIPENLNLNYALQRSYSIENEKRDVYYNFGQHIMSNWSWSDPGTWWTFNKMGLDSVDLIFDASKGGKLEHRNDYIARYQTEKIKVTPDKGYRIANLLLESNGESKDVTDQITWEDGENYIKIRNATDNVRLTATFEKVPSTKGTLTGNVTWNGKNLSAELQEDINLRFISGGVAYTSVLTENGTYSFEVPTGRGVLEIFSKNHQYVAKRIPIDVTQTEIRTAIKLTSDDYGNKRTMELADEQVMGNKERLFNGEKMTGSMSNTFAYDFTLKYNGQLLEEDGTPVADPTFGEYDHQYTAISVKGVFTDAAGKPLNKTDMNLQIMSWDGNGIWMIKMWLDGKTVTARIGIDELQGFGSEEGVRFRLIFADSTLGLYVVRGNNAFKIRDIKATSTVDRYLKTIDFSADHCIRHSIWAIQNQRLSLGKSQASYHLTGNVANGDGVVEFKRNKDDSTPRTATNWEASDFNGAFGWTGKLRVPGVLKNGKIQYHDMTTGYWVDTSKDKKTWYQYNIFLIGDGSSYYVTKNTKTTKLKLNNEQMKLLGTTGLQMGAFAQGSSISYFVDNGKGEMVVFADLYDYNVNSAWFPWPNQYNGAHMLHKGSEKIGKVISVGAEFYTGLSKEMDTSGFVKNILGLKYQSIQAVNPVVHNFGPNKANYFVMRHSNVPGNAFYGYNIQSDAVNAEGNIVKTTSVYFNTRAWTSDKYYSNFVKLRVASDSAYFIWQQGVSPYASSEAVYFLNQAQRSLLAKGGLNIYIEYKDHSTKMNLYVDDGAGNIVLASTYDENLFKKTTGVNYLKHLIGYSVEVANTEANVTVTSTGCVAYTNGDFSSNVKALYNKAIVNGGARPGVIKIDSGRITKPSEEIDNDYYNFNIGGNWFDRFNVKLADAVDGNGKIQEDAIVKLNARLEGDKYYGQTMNLYLEKDGIGYLEYINYGGKWERYRYGLTKEQLAELATADGLNFYVNHIDNENKITVFVENGADLIPLKTFEYGNHELWAKGYFGSYEGTEDCHVDITMECYKYEGSFTTALRQIYGKSYTEQSSEPLSYIELTNNSKEFAGTDKETLQAKHGKAGDPSIWQFQLHSDVVDANGRIVNDSKTEIVIFANGYKYQFNTTLDLSVTEGALTLQEGVLGNWAMHKYYMNAEQLAKLATKEGLKLYVSYEANQVTVYVEEGSNTLVKALSFTQDGIEMEDSRITYYKSAAKMKAQMNCYSYTNGDLRDALGAIYGEAYEIREKTALEKARVTMHTIDTPSEKINMDYNDDTKVAPVNGNWVQHFNVKLGENQKTETVNLVTRLYGDKYYQQITDIRVTEGGAYFEVQNYGVDDGNWNTYVYPLNAAQLAQLSGANGLDVYISCESSNKITVYFAEGSQLIKVKEFTYGTSALKGKGYSVSYVGNDKDKVQVISECVKVENSITDAWKSIFEKTYTEAPATGLYSYRNVLKTSDFNKTFTSEDKKSLANYSKLWNDYFYRINIQNAGVNEDGTVAEASKVTIYNKAYRSNTYKAQTVVVFDIKKDAPSTVQFQLGRAPWTKQTVELTEKQMKALGSQYGLNIYFTHGKEAADTFEVYLEDGKTLKEMFTAQYPGATNGGECVVQCNALVSDIRVEGDAYNYADTDLFTAINTVYGKALTRPESELRSFVNLAGKSNTGDFGKKQFDGKKINQLMGTDGYSYLFHTRLKSADNPAALATYTGWGQQQEKCYIQIQKDSDNKWYLYLKTYSQWHRWKDVGKIALSEAQLAQMKGNGLDMFLVNSDSTKFSLYVENDTSSDVILVAEYTSLVTNKQIYMVEHNVAGFTTQGYFYKYYATGKDAATDLLDTVK